MTQRTRGIMKHALPTLVTGLVCGLSIWTAQTVDLPHWGVAISAFLGGFLGFSIGQLLSRKF